MIIYIYLLSCVLLKFHSWIDLTTHFTLLGTTFTRYDLKKTPSPFQDLAKFHQRTTYFRPPPTIRYENVTSKHANSILKKWNEKKLTKFVKEDIKCIDY